MVLRQALPALLALSTACLLLAVAPAGALGAPGPASRASGGFEVGKLQRNLETGTGKLFVRVPGPGDLFLHGAGILPIDREPARAEVVRFPVVLIGPAKQRLLREASATVRAKVTFTPENGEARTKTKMLTLRAALPK
jgi:hypothetical protein